MNAAKPLVFVAAALLASSVFAQGAPPPGSSRSTMGEQPTQSAQQKFAQMDKNKDHQLSKSEASSDPNLTAMFDSVDADSDGYISQREYAAYAASEGHGQQQREPSDDNY